MYQAKNLFEVLNLSDYFDEAEIEKFDSFQFASILLDNFSISNKPFLHKLCVLDKYCPYKHDNKSILIELREHRMKDLLECYRELLEIKDCSDCKLKDNENTIDYCNYCTIKEV